MALNGSIDIGHYVYHSTLNEEVGTKRKIVISIMTSEGVTEKFIDPDDAELVGKALEAAVAQVRGQLN